ncbi:MAG TPA: hypothetical protein VFE58_05930 [Tepidisphaeraceae bacterium]|nr:hypothetical protein [Tepidisphaeraceae bacterium]
MDRREIETINLHQTVHGYAGGHRLIQSSVSLPLSAQRLLVILSDLSGPTSVSGFDTYLTGYAIVGTEYYALARTWIAPEMERPGCVWTHTLLIRQEDLQVIPDCRRLNQFFRRPKRDDLSPTFSRPITVDLSDPDYPSSLNVGQAATVLKAIYEGQSPVFMQCDTSAEADDLFLGIWSQQWPTLKTRFFFCSGSLSNREIGGRSFDLQAISSRLSREIRREVRRAIILEGRADEPPSSGWLKQTLEDLRQTGETPLRTFLACVAWPSAGRDSFKALVEMNELAADLDGSAEGFEELIRLVAQRYPGPDEGIELKNALTGAHGAIRDFIKLPTRSAILRKLSITSVYPAFDANLMGLAELAGELWVDDSAAALELLVWLSSSPLNPLGEEIFRGLIAKIGANEIGIIVQHASRMLPAIVTSKPSLAAVSTIWKVSPDRQREIVDTMVSSNAATNAVDVMPAVLSAGADAAAEGISQLFGSEVVVPILEWLDDNYAMHGSNLGSKWARLLANNSAITFNWLAHRDKIRIETVAYIARTLNPNSKAVRDVAAKFWLRLLDLSSGVLAWPEMISFHAFLFTIALNNNGVGSDQLAARSFEVVYRAAELDEIPYDTWRIIQSELPSLPWWQGWDQCERLRRGIIAVFVRYEWPPESIFRCTSDPKLFAAILNSSQELKQGPQFFNNLANSVKSNRIHGPAQLEAILLAEI